MMLMIALYVHIATEYMNDDTDTEMIRRLMERGHSIGITLRLPCQRLPDRASRNLVFEIKGSEKPEEIVIIGGHTDCWLV